MTVKLSAVQEDMACCLTRGTSMAGGYSSLHREKTALCVKGNGIKRYQHLWVSPTLFRRWIYQPRNSTTQFYRAKSDQWTKSTWGEYSQASMSSRTMKQMQQRPQFLAGCYRAWKYLQLCPNLCYLRIYLTELEFFGLVLLLVHLFLDFWKTSHTKARKLLWNRHVFC